MIGKRVGIVMVILVASGLVATSASGQVVGMPDREVKHLSRADQFELGIWTPPKPFVSRCQPRLDETKVQDLTNEIQQAFFFDGKESRKIARRWLLNGYGKPSNGRVKKFNPDDLDWGGWKNGVTLGITIDGGGTSSGGILSGTTDYWTCTPEYCVEPPTYIGSPACPACPTPPPWCCACGDPPGCKTQYWIEYHKYEGFADGWCWCGALFPCYCNAATRHTMWEPWQEHAEVCAEKIVNKIITDLATFEQTEYDANCSTTCAEPGHCCGENPCESCSPVSSYVECCVYATADFIYTDSAICVPYSDAECPPNYCQ